MVNATPQAAYFRERNPVPIVQEAEGAPGPVWTGAENPASTEIRSPDRPARSESLCRLRYPGPLYFKLLFRSTRNVMKPLGVIAFFDIENRSGISAKRTSTSQITVLVLVQSLTSH